MWVPNGLATRSPTSHSLTMMEENQKLGRMLSNLCVYSLHPRLVVPVLSPDRFALSPSFSWHRFYQSLSCCHLSLASASVGYVECILTWRPEGGSLHGAPTWLCCSGGVWTSFSSEERLICFEAISSGMVW